MASDNELWLSQTVRKKTADKLWVEARGHVRLDENASHLQKLMPELRLDWKPQKWLEFSAGYRLVFESDDDSLDAIAHRYHFDAGVEKGWRWLELDYRVRYQEKHPQDSVDFTTVLRNRWMASAKRKGSDFKPSMGIELFSDPATLDRVRFTLACAYAIKKGHRLRVRLHHQSETDGDEVRRIVAMDYQFKLPKKSKKAGTN